jgi:hypothetical protein
MHDDRRCARWIVSGAAEGRADRRDGEPEGRSLNSGAKNARCAK